MSSLTLLVLHVSDRGTTLAGDACDRFLVLCELNHEGREIQRNISCRIQATLHQLQSLCNVAILDSFVGGKTDGDVHDADALKLEERYLVVVGSAGNFAEQETRYLVDAVP